MAFFNDLGKKITQTSQGVVQKTKDTAETIKLSATISDEERRIANLFSKIGKTYFELHADSYEPELEQMILGIKEAQEKIESCSEQIKRLKGVVRCPNCGSEVPYDAPFCSSCGSRINVQSAPPDVGSNVRRCVKCGVPISPDMAFCTNCGTKVEDIPEPVDVPEEDIAPAAEELADAAPAATKVCPSCGREISASASFCIGCGCHIEN